MYPWNIGMYVCVYTYELVNNRLYINTIYQQLGFKEYLAYKDSQDNFDILIEKDWILYT